MKTTFLQKIALIAIGFFLGLILLETGMRAAGFILLSIQEYRNVAVMKHKGTVRILCLGESTTQAGPEPYPEQLERVLNERDTGIRFSVINKGLSGITSTYIADHLEENLNTFKPDVVITMMGVNDSGAHMPYEYASPGRQLSFSEKLRVYKLARYLWLHLTARVREWQTSFHQNESKKTSGRDRSFTDAVDASTDSSGNKGILPVPPAKDPMREGYDCINNGRGPEAEKIFETVITRHPGDYDAYIGLAMAYDRQGRYEESEKTYQKAIKLQPDKTRAYLELGGLHHRTGKEKEAEKYFQKAVQIEPDDSEANFQLGWSYKLQGMEVQAKEQFRKGAELIRRGESIPIDSEAWRKMDWLWGRLAVLYKDIGDPALAEEYYNRANAYRNGYYNLVTRENYQKIKKMLDQRGVKFVCVQYPVRSAEPFNKIFEGQAGVIFVDNEKVFKDALKRGDYKEYFTDIFGGDFGHCTAKGNKLLAENIANVILKEIFHQ